MPPAASLSSTRQGPSLAPIRGSTNSSSAIWCVGSLQPAEAVFQLFPEGGRGREAAQGPVLGGSVGGKVGTARDSELPAAGDIEKTPVFRRRAVAVIDLDGPDRRRIE